jgi:C4-dicarboxylate-specific signal transduction histidine kinase
LNVIRMAAENILRKAARGGATPEYLADKLGRVTQNVERAAQIIDHMRIFGRKETAPVDDVDPVRIIDNVVGMIGQQMRLSGIELDVRMPDACPKLRVNPVQLEQVLLNLVGNARDALLDGAGGERRIVLEIEADAQTAAGDDAVAFRVRDTGGGVPAHVVARMFDPFFTTKDVGKGTGLGLSISYGIVNDWGGTLSARNVDDGAEFTVLVPVKGKRALADEDAPAAGADD